MVRPYVPVEHPVPLLKRMAVFIGDLFLMQFVIMQPFSGYLRGIINSGPFAYDPSLGPALTPLFAIFSLGAVLYFSIFQYLFAQTPIMMLAGIYVKSERGGLTLAQCLMRNSFLVPFFPFFILWLVDPAYYAISGTYQRWSEYLSSTRLVQEAIHIPKI